MQKIIKGYKLNVSKWIKKIVSPKVTPTYATNKIIRR